MGTGPDTRSMWQHRAASFLVPTIPGAFQAVPFHRASPRFQQLPRQGFLRALPESFLPGNLNDYIINASVWIVKTCLTIHYINM